jgi:hypothetical protein
LFLLAVAIVFFLPVFFCADGLRSSGLLYQLTGIGTIVWAISTRFRAWGAPWSKVAKSISLAAGKSSARGRSPQLTKTSERLDWLEARQHETEEKFGKLEGDITQRFNEQRAQFAMEIKP